MRTLGVLVSAAAMTSAAAAGDIDALSTTWAADWSNKKLDAVLSLYAPNAVFLPTSRKRWSGTTEIRRNFAALLTQVSADLHLHSLKTGMSGDLAYDSGSYEETITPVKTGKIMHLNGDYLFLFQRQKNGEWKILEQTFTAYDPTKL